MENHIKEPTTMSASLASNQPKILPCPTCGEMIYSNVTTCRFCSAPLDMQAAEAAASNQQEVNNACNQAKWIRHMAVTMWVLLGVSLVLTAGQAGALAFFFIIPALLIYWQIKYGRLKTADPDYLKARRDRRLALFIWLPAALIEVLMILLRVAG
jgi:predicted RNA-binding Zn-ribbon protein involved in translation (DUF1610 family)